MRRGLFVFMMLALAPAVMAVTVGGHVYLAGQTDHGGTRVLFEASSPSAQTDSAYTDNTGGFSKALQPGVYRIEYGHAGYADYDVQNVLLLFDTTLDSVSLMPGLSGALTGVIARGDYDVTDTIRVNVGQTLDINPGARMFFRPRAALIVNGLLRANGIAGDSVVFTRRYAEADSGWEGVQFVTADSNSVLDFCVIEKAEPSYFRGYTYNGTLMIYATSIDVRNSSVRANRRFNYVEGTGIFCWSASPKFQDCLIADNSGSFGSGIYVLYGAPRFESCRIADNFANENGGGAFIESADSAVFLDCTFEQNRANLGGALRISGPSNVRVVHNRFLGNEANMGGGAIASGSAQAEFVQCLFAHNRSSNSSTISASRAMRLERCTIVAEGGDSPIQLFNWSGEINSTVILSRSPYAIQFSESPHGVVKYCAVYGSEEGAFGFEDSLWPPPGIGMVALTNANGDSCDTYYNIFGDPMLADTGAGDYHLTAESPCVDAGDPALPRDPDGSIADIGAYYFAHGGADAEVVTPLASQFALYPSFPNPFNSATRIRFAVAQNGPVELDVYDISGRLVQPLLRGTLSAGGHEVTLDAAGWSSGVYFCCLRAAGRTATQKLLLVK